ncbi:membrane protein [Salinimicrobium terrae]|uniref:membrane protein n=1 Tax=Salinimicrobium terrae TaxID=470866 RepID=UPI00055FC2E9|nr:membrane protein [Salinimicrobium terrae]
MRSRILLSTILILLLSYDVEAQCAMCRAVLETEESQSTAEGINDGIVYLMVFPYLLMAGIAYFIWKSRKKGSTRE